MSELLRETESLCPECLSRIPARRISEDGNIYLEKSCPEHGKYKLLIWRQDLKHYLDWGKYSEPAAGPLKSLTNINQGCPYDCGICPEHKTNACTMVMDSVRAKSPRVAKWAPSNSLPSLRTPDRTEGPAGLSDGLTA